MKLYLYFLPFLSQASHEPIVHIVSRVRLARRPRNLLMRLLNVLKKIIGKALASDWELEFWLRVSAHGHVVSALRIDPVLIVLIFNRAQVDDTVVLRIELQLRLRQKVDT